MTPWAWLSAVFVAFFVLEIWRAWWGYKRLQRTLLLILDAGPRSSLELSAVLGGGTYTALAALEDRGVVRRYETAVDIARGGRSRSYYELV